MECENNRFVLLRRVSSKSQEASGLGLDAQMTEINSYLQTIPGASVEADLVEVESGGKELSERPVLAHAMDLAAKSGSVILVSRLCRLSRDLEFVAGLMKSKVRFRIATNPGADELTIGIYAVMARHERLEIGRRTRQALAAAKARGVRLGAAGAQNIEKANERKIQRADQFAETLRPVVEPLREAGKTFKEIAEILNHMGMVTAHGKKFVASTVHRITMRYA